MSPAQLVEALEAEFSEYFGLEPGSPEMGALLGSTLSDVVELSESAIPDYEFLYSQVRIGEGASRRGGKFRHQPTPAALWAFLAKMAAPGDRVEFTMFSSNGQRSTAHHWPFSLRIAEEMTRPAAPSSVTPSSDDTKMVTKSLGRLRLAWGVASGPPTWKLPKMKVEVQRGGFAIQAGWLQTLLIFGLHLRSRTTEPA